jgi:hypothetical protein
MGDSTATVEAVAVIVKMRAVFADIARFPKQHRMFLVRWPMRLANGRSCNFLNYLCDLFDGFDFMFAHAVAPSSLFLHYFCLTMV